MIVENLSEIKGVSAKAMRLLQAAGVDGPADLAEADADALHRDLGAANEREREYKKLPSRDAVAGWISGARAAVADGAGSREAPGDDDRVEDEPAVDLEALLEEAFEATALYDRHRRPIETAGQRRISPQPRESAASEQTGTAARPRARITPRVSESSPEAEASRHPLDVNRIHTFEEHQHRSAAVPEAAPSPQPAFLTSRAEARRQQRIDAGTTGGVPRWIRRGIQYPDPIRLWLALLCVLISRVLFFVVAIGTPIAVIWFRESLPDFLWVAAAFGLFGFIHIILAARVRCKVCSVHLLLNRRCHKNSKAHRPYLLGWVGNLALHGLIFRWFRCMYCGTPIQLRLRRSAHNRG